MEPVVTSEPPISTAMAGGGQTDGIAEPTRLRLFGVWQLTDRGTDAPVKVPVNVQRLLALLALAGPQPRTVVAGKLWPETTESHAHGCLRTVLWRLHRSGRRHLVDVQGEVLVLGTGVDVDVHEFLAWVDTVVGHDLCPPGQLLLGPSSGAGELLPGWYDDWVLVQRERLRQLRLYALETLADRLLMLNRCGEALMAGLEAVSLEPLRESAHRLVVRVHLADGNVAEALRHFESYRRLLRRELGLPPSEGMIDLVRPFRAPSRFPKGAASKSGSNGSHLLPGR